MDLDTFLSRLERVKHQSGGQYEARCPAHHDTDPSLSVREGEHGSIVFTCHTGCDKGDILSSMFLTFADVAGRPHMVAQYVYTDEAGAPLYTIERWAAPKTFKGYLPPQAERVPYNLVAVAWARRTGVRVYVCEGEKDCDRLSELNIPATCNPNGAGKWFDHYSPFLAGLDVTVIADNDPLGRAHARAVAASVGPHAKSVVVVVPRYGNDVSDLLDLGYTLDLLDPIPEGESLGAINAANVTPTRVTWAWDGYIPFGKVTIVEGDPGDGKSVLTVDWVARWTSGLKMPDGIEHGGPYNAVMVTAEDDPADTIVPRLIAAGAYRERVTVVTNGGEPDQPFNIAVDMAELRLLVMKKNIKIVTLDPLMAMTGDGVDTNVDAQVRRGLFPLYQLARDTGCAVIVVRHLNKGTGRRAIYRGGGSIGFVGAARAAYTIGRDPEDRERRIMACVKMNVAREPVSLAYTVDEGPVGPYLTWHGQVDLDAQSVVDGNSGHAGEKFKDAIEFLDSVVENDPLTWKEILKIGADEGHTGATLLRAREASRIEKIVGKDGTRSIRWGYMRHQPSHAPQPKGTPPLTHQGPFTHTSGNEKMGNFEKVGPGAPSLYVVPSPFTQPHEQMGSGDELSELERRDAEVEALPLVCSECGTEEKVNRYLKPYWVVRCRAHSPLVYKEKGIEE